MESIRLEIEKTKKHINNDELQAYINKAHQLNISLEKGTGKGSEFLGWLNLPSTTSKELLDDIEATAKSLSQKIQYVVVVGIGGSYMGAKAIYDAMRNSFSELEPNGAHPKLLFAGQNLSEDYLAELVEFLDGKRFAIVVISKSGTTTEPALAFRLLKNLLERQVGRAIAKELIIAITDQSKGALRALANQEAYKSYVIEDDIGGRFSVLSPVGLVPLAIAGINIKELIKGAQSMESLCQSDKDPETNPAILYAACRNILYQQGKKNEMLVNYNEKLQYLLEWWKQLFGESEGKDGKGIFPSALNFTTDLHSMGQYIQDGERTIFETVLSIDQPNSSLTVPKEAENLDKLNYLAGLHIDHVNKMAELGTSLSHIDGGVPNLIIRIPRLNEFHLGELLYFFERSCAISGYILDVNPFDQPGVEGYKSNMFALLEKPGFEEQTKAIKERLNK